MPGIMERNQQKVELAQLGYSLKYIDDWPPKTTLYRHKPSYNVEGMIVEDIGTMAPNVPGNPDYVLSKARIGMFPWPPSATCTCKWCGNKSNEKRTKEVKTEVDTSVITIEV